MSSDCAQRHASVFARPQPVMTEGIPLLRAMALFTLGGLAAGLASTRTDLLALPTLAALDAAGLLDAVGVVEIDPEISDAHV